MSDPASSKEEQEEWKRGMSEPTSDAKQTPEELMKASQEVLTRAIYNQWEREEDGNQPHHAAIAIAGGMLGAKYCETCGKNVSAATKCKNGDYHMDLLF